MVRWSWIWSWIWSWNWYHGVQAGRVYWVVLPSTHPVPTCTRTLVLPGPNQYQKQCILRPPDTPGPYQALPHTRLLALTQLASGIH